MLDRIRRLLLSPEDAAPAHDDLQIAVAVLLVEAARMDDHFHDAERPTIERMLAEKFHLSTEAPRELLALAETTDQASHQYYPFTRLPVERMDPHQRIGLLETRWYVAYTDAA